MTTTVPPHSLEAEEAVLGGILLDPGAIGRIADVLKPDAFYLSAHQQIFRTALMLHSQGQVTDLTSMVTWLADLGHLQQVGGAQRLATLMDMVSSTAAIEQVAAIITDRYLRRQLIGISTESAAAAASTTPLDDILTSTEAQLFALQHHHGQADGLTHAATVVTTVLSEAETRSISGKQLGIPTGFYDLDRLTQGLQRGDLVILAGRPSMGKTAVGINLAHHAATSGFPVVVFSLEMSKEQLTYRLLAMQSGIESSRLRAGTLAADEWALVNREANAIGQLPLWFQDQPQTAVTRMASLCRRLVAESGRELGMVVIDYLQLMEGSGSDNRVQELSRITRGLKGMARELNVPVVALSQLSRGVESRTNKRPMLSDLRESGSIEQDADLVMMVYRDEYYNPETPERGITELIISKHRNGPIGTVKLLFESQYTRFRNLASS